MEKTLIIVLVSVLIIGGIGVGIYLIKADKMSGPRTEQGGPSASGPQAPQGEENLAKEDFSVYIPEGWRKTAPPQGVSAMVINADEKKWQGKFTKDDLISDTKTKIHTRKYIEGKDIDEYIIERIRYLEWGTKRVPHQLSRATFLELYDRPKIMRGRVTGGIYDDTGLVCNDSIVIFVKFTDLHSVENKSIRTSVKKFNNLQRLELEKISEKFDLKYLLAILNSSFAFKYLNNIRRHRLENYFYPDDFRKLPIADIAAKDQKPYIDLVDKILAITKDDDYLQNEDKQAKVKEYEHQIDQMVYKLYGLTGDEIKIVEK